MATTSDAARNRRHSEDFKRRLTILSDAAVGTLLVRTREPYRLLEDLYHWTISSGFSAFEVWTVLTGWQQFPTTVADGEQVDLLTPRGQDGLLDIGKALEALKSKPREGCFAMFSPQHWMEAPTFQQHIKVHAQRAMQSTQRLVLIVPEGCEVPSSIQHDVKIVDYLTPSHAELKAQWRATVSVINEEWRPRLSDDEVDVLIENSIGLTTMEFDTATAIAIVQLRDQIAKGEDLSADDFLHYIMQDKVEIIKRSGILELMEPADPAHVGGLDLLMAWLDKRKNAFSDAAREFGVDMPRGVLAVGVPGSGKSLLAKAIGRIFQYPLVRFDPGRVFGQYVGQSESRMREALHTIDSIAPCVLLMDEIDKAFAGAGGGGGDSGTTMRVFGMFLTWLQERDARSNPVFVIMTANNIGHLPPELLRKGRVDEIFCVGFPTERERLQILKIHLAKRGHEVPDDELMKVVRKTSEFVGAELEAIVAETITECFAADEPVSAAQMLKQAELIVPMSKSRKPQIDAMVEWAKNNARAASSGETFGAHPEGTGVTPGRRLILNKPVVPGQEAGKSLVRPIRPGRRHDQ